VRAAPYARLSQDRAGLSENIDIQLAEARGYCQEQAWEVVDEFTDNDISASRYSSKPRPDYQRLLAAIRAGHVDVVVVTEMPRLYRRLEELLEIIYLAETTPLRRIQPTEGGGYDLSTGEGIHNAVSAVNNAALESRKISDRVKRKRKAQARNGDFLGGPRPFGYQCDGVTVIEAEAALLREAIQWILDGGSVIGVVRDWNARGIATATGKRWRTSSLRKILTSKRLIGVQTYQGVEYPARWPAITDPATFEQLQLVLKAEGRTGRNAGNKHGRRYLLTGFVYCSLCGAQLVGYANRNYATSPPKRRYFCKRYDDHGIQRGCAGISRLAEPLEALVTEAVLDVLDSPKMTEIFASATQNLETAELIADYQQHKAKLEDLVADYATGLLSREQLAQAKAIVEAAMDATQRRLEKLQSGRALASVPAGQSIRQAWAANGPDWRRSLVGLLVEKVILHPSQGGSHRWPEDEELAERLGQTWTFDPAKVEIRWRV
jgi:DNA invertase Pin-like site-specific DNA recombinase